MPNATRTVAVCCLVCRNTRAVAIVRDFAHATYPVCRPCLDIMNRCHPSRPVVVTS